MPTVRPGDVIYADPVITKSSADNYEGTVLQIGADIKRNILILPSETLLSSGKATLFHYFPQKYYNRFRAIFEKRF